ncbi:MAG: carboxypeptidase-like regulatory domain-containing protein [Cyclobacteriaceae bacterium]|nr:carboxypeptidase-like regulatory domain-containing protein [Cyclobacteriaceae bacterium]
MRKLYTTLLLFCVSFGWAQKKDLPLLERTLSISVVGETIPALLNRIGHAGGFSFSYNSAILDANQEVSLDATNQTVRNLLNEIFQGSMNYKEKGNYLILTKALPPPVKNNGVTLTINGYVEDAKSGEKIPYASVYDKKSITSTVTDEFGYFKLKLEKKIDSISLSVSKKNYRDTLINITMPLNQYVTITIYPIVKDTTTAIVVIDGLDSTVVADKKKEEVYFPYESQPNIQNIRDTLHNLVQVSFLPFLGTNGRLSANTINDYSINFFGGYSMGTNQIELGFFFNLDRSDVKWLQIAGFGNMVGGKVYGVQAAGFFNLNGGETEAVQLSGFANTNLDNTYGVQIAGFANTTLGDMYGAQVAGFTNFTGGRGRGMQVAGFGNVQVGNYRGSQFAGFTNIAAERITGSQISTFFNYGRKVHGTQIGFINYADSLGGVPIGFLSIVKTGYHKIELSADEVFYANLAFRTGARKFHTMLMAGFKPQQSLHPSDTSVWHFGYGIGTTRKLTRWWFLDLDLSAHHVNKGSFTNALSLLNKANVGFDFQVAKKLSLATGITLNGYLTRTTFTDYPTLFSDYQPKIISDTNFGNDLNLKLWLGAKIALRFL